MLTDEKETDPVRPDAPQAAFTVVDTAMYCADERDLLTLIAEYPLAWIMPREADAAHAHLLPLLARTDADGHLTALIGHMGRRNTLARAFGRDPRALILFTGPQGYVSTRGISNPTWAPTWNYAQARIEADVRLEPDRGDAALRELVEAMDGEHRTGWRPEHVGPRYRAMEQAIIAFSAQVTGVATRFKLGQDERLETLREILAQDIDPALARWMRRANRSRLDGHADGVG